MKHQPKDTTADYLIRLKQEMIEFDSECVEQREFHKKKIKELSHRLKSLRMSLFANIATAVALLGVLIYILTKLICA